MGGLNKHDNVVLMALRAGVNGVNTGHDDLPLLPFGIAPVVRLSEETGWLEATEITQANFAAIEAADRRASILRSTLTRIHGEVHADLPRALKVANTFLTRTDEDWTWIDPEEIKLLASTVLDQARKLERSNPKAVESDDTSKPPPLRSNPNSGDVNG